jgi:diguanylate cyclase
VAERIRVTLDSARPALVDGTRVPLSASLGVATIEGANPEAVGEQWLDGLVTAADRALYQAKSEGRNRVSAAELLAGVAP